MEKIELYGKKPFVYEDLNGFFLVSGGSFYFEKEEDRDIVLTFSVTNIKNELAKTLLKKYGPVYEFWALYPVGNGVISGMNMVIMGNKNIVKWNLFWELKYRALTLYAKFKNRKFTKES